MKQLASLIGFGLWGVEPPAALLPASEEEWQRLFDLSRRQAVTALLYDAVLKLPKEQRPPRRVLFHFTSITQTIGHDNRCREEALMHFAALLQSELSLPAVVVKGSSLAGLYPKPLYRECGDNDLYTGSDTERIGALMEARGVAVDRKDPRHISFVYDGATFECHNYLLYHNDDIVWETKPLVLESDANVPSDATHPTLRAPLSERGWLPHHDDYQQNEKTAAALSPLGEGSPKAGVCSGKLLTLRSEQSAFFLAKHCEHHAVFFHNPVRLRSLVDWCLLTGSSEFDYAAFQAVKQGSDVDVFADLMSCYCNSLFGVHLPYDAARLKAKGLEASDFDRLYLQCHERHKRAFVRVVRRSWKYLRYGRLYRAIYGQSMFRRFYLHNVGVALRQHI